MEIILTRENTTSGEINKGLNRYMDVVIKKGKVKIEFKDVYGSIIIETFNKTQLKSNISKFVSFKFIYSEDCVLDYRLYL